MTTICYIGIELSARIQQGLLAAEFLVLVIFAVVALVKVYSGDAAPGGEHLHLSLAEPVRDPRVQQRSPRRSCWRCSSTGAGTAGWRSTRRPRTPPRRPAGPRWSPRSCSSAIYVVVADRRHRPSAAPSCSPTTPTTSSPRSGTRCSASALDKLLIIAVLTSASASTQTTILPTARTALSMARARAIPKAFGDIHPEHLSPGVATLAMGGGIDRVVRGADDHQPELPDRLDPGAGAGNRLLLRPHRGGVRRLLPARDLQERRRTSCSSACCRPPARSFLPLLFVKSCFDLGKKDAGDTVIFGVGGPLVIGLGALLLGIPLMLWANLKYPDFFKRKRRGRGSRRATGMEQLMADIVVGYDGSAGAQAALALALDAARALEDRVVVAFGFRDPLVGGENADLIAALQELGRSRLAEAAARAGEAGVEVEQVVIAEDPAHALADLAAQRRGAAHRGGNAGRASAARCAPGLHSPQAPADLPDARARRARRDVGRGARCARSSSPSTGRPEVLQVQERPDPEPGRRAGPHRRRAPPGINFADLMARVGLYPDAPDAAVRGRLRGRRRRSPAVGDGRRGPRGRRPRDGAARASAATPSRSRSTAARRRAAARRAVASSRAPRSRSTTPTAWAALIRYGDAAAGRARADPRRRRRRRHRRDADRQARGAPRSTARRRRASTRRSASSASTTRSTTALRLGVATCRPVRRDPRRASAGAASARSYDAAAPRRAAGRASAPPAVMAGERRNLRRPPPGPRCACRAST